MVLFIKDTGADALAQDPGSLTRASETEAVQQAPRGALACVTDDLVAQSTTFARELREMAGPNPQPIDQAFLDGLYKDP